ncbi:MAG TPA: CDP-diacylglycerol--glycerol-3-phosphate 3-phosphatidyltransferase [Steroidobacteraceae bacterium]|nr:CDP-diacylglycerol--glycerol-3-phosphate 3-phosphatidyltransferase [Steroidobacteraceae bacterium]
MESYPSRPAHAADSWTLPNVLTWVRIAAIPLVVIAFYLPASWSDPAAGLIFAAAGVTDSLDGYLARRLGQTTRLGAFLDPVADKLIVATALVLLVSRDHRPLIVLTAAVIIGREIAISALREWMAELGKRRKVAVSILGKYKTILQIVGLAMMLYRHPLGPLPLYPIGVALTVLAAALTLISMVMYLRAAWPHLREG